jgi:hypothetical protein
MSRLVELFHKHAVPWEALFHWGLGTRAESPRKFLNFDSLKCHFLDFGEVLTVF